MSWLIGQDDSDVTWAGPEWISIEDAASMCDATIEQIQRLVKGRSLSASVYRGNWEIYARGIYGVVDLGLVQVASNSPRRVSYRADIMSSGNRIGEG